MTRYRIHQFDADDHVLVSSTIDCADDHEALELFRGVRCLAQAVELWQGRRLVNRFHVVTPPRLLGRMQWPRS